MYFFSPSPLAPAPDDMRVTPVEDMEVIVKEDPTLAAGAEDEDAGGNTVCAEIALEVCDGRDGTFSTSALVDEAVCGGSKAWRVATDGKLPGNGCGCG